MLAHAEAPPPPAIEAQPATGEAELLPPPPAQEPPHARDAALAEMAGFKISLGWTIDALRDPIETVTILRI